MAIKSRDEYIGWLKNVWAGTRWESLPGYSREEVSARAARYASLPKPGSGLLPSFGGYHDRMLEPWVGAEFFAARPRVGVFLREFPLPCWDRKWRDLLEGHGGTSVLPETAMPDSVRAVCDGNTAYGTISKALDGVRVVLRQIFDIEIEDLRDVAARIVLADWVRPFAMFRSNTGLEFDAEHPLSKSSCHRREMYDFAGPLLAQEVGPGVLDLDIVVVMGLGMFDRAWAHLGPATSVWPLPDSRGRFKTLREKPAPGAPPPRLVVLPHPVTVEFDQALKVLRSEAAPLAASAERLTAGGLPVSPRQDDLLDELQERIEGVRGPAEVGESVRSRYRRLSWPKRSSVYLQLTGKGIAVKSKFDDEVYDALRGAGWNVWEERDHDCVLVPSETSQHQIDELFETLEKALRHR